MMSTTVLNKEKIEEYISENNKRLEITMANDVIWDVDLSGVSDYGDIDINLAVDLEATGIPQNLIEGCVDGNEYTQIELKHEGAFGFPVTMKIPSDTEMIGKIANLFWYNPETETMEYINEGRVGEDGYASFILDHASMYVIAYADASLDPKLTKTLNISDTESSETDSIGETDETQPILGATETEPGSFIAENIILLYGAIAIALILIGSLAAGVAIKKKKNDDYYYDEED